MPILPAEPSIFPADLLTRAAAELPQVSPADDVDDSVRWWVMYTKSRHEKQLMRKLVALETSFCCPVISRRYRSPNGRVRCVHEPLFANYVFVYGDGQARHGALETNCVSRCQPVGPGLQLTQDLAQIWRLIETGAALSPESRLEPGDRVRVRTGSFAGFEGTILQRQNETRLLVAVQFMQQGASVLLDDCQLEYLGDSMPRDQQLSYRRGTIDVVYDHDVQRRTKAPRQ